MLKSSLSERRRRLLEAMQRLDFGRIEGLQVEDGEPVFRPGPRVVRDIKIGNDNGPRPELGADDFALKAQHVELLRYLNELRDGTIEVLEIKNGLPFRICFEDPAA